MDFQKIIAFLGLLLSVVALSLVFTNQQKVAYVNLGQLIYSYKGMANAHLDLEKSKQQVQGQYATAKALADSLAYLQDSLTKNGGSKEQILKVNGHLRNQAAYLQQLSKGGAQMINKKDQELTEGVLNQIRSFVEEYGEQNGYDIIIGKGQDDNVLYASEGKDITQELIEAINKDYE